MKKIVLTLYLISCTYILYSQNEATNWFFGQNAGITFDTFPPVFLSGGQLNTNEGASSVSDNAGNLLFYSDGISVINKNHNLMPNGCCLTGSHTTTQSCLIVPDPGNPSQYYLFTPPDEYSTDSLRYSIVDLTLNGGLGDVSVKNIALMANPTEKVGACYHANGTGIWVITHRFSGADFYAWLITAAGISSTPVISAAGSIYNNSTGNKVGQLKISPCGDKIASAVNHNDILELFDFDNATGVVSNPLQLGAWPNMNGYGVYGTEFSPDASKLYASFLQPAIVIQFNLLAGSASAIIASADTIGVSPNNYNGALQSGPDGKIYLAKKNDHFLACITDPDQLGDSCDYVEDYVSLDSTICSLGLPSFFSSWFCKSFTGIENAIMNNRSFTIYPNPASELLTISAFHKQKISLFDMLGHLIIEKDYEPGIKSDLQINVSGLSPGIYFIRAGNEVRRFVKQ